MPPSPEEPTIQTRQTETPNHKSVVGKQKSPNWRGIIVGFAMGLIAGLALASAL